MVARARLKPSRTWARRYKAAWGWSKRAVNTAGMYLAADDARMTQFKEDCEAAWAAAGVKKHMLFNWDQLWKEGVRAKKKKLHKVRSQVGRRAPDRLASWKRKALVAAGAADTLVPAPRTKRARLRM